MSAHDEKIRNDVNDALAHVGVDIRNLTIESSDRHLVVRGTVPSIDQQEAMIGVFRAFRDQVTSLECDVGLRKVAPPDASDGRGRSPVTGTSADSAHESRHQLDRS